MHYLEEIKILCYYNPKINIAALNNSFFITVEFTEPRYFFPSFLSRIILRILCSTATTSKYTRKMIDFIRKRKASALNQSSNAGKTKSINLFLNRKIIISDTKVILNDEIVSRNKINANSLFEIIEKDNNIELKKIENNEITLIDNKIKISEKIFN